MLVKSTRARQEETVLVNTSDYSHTELRKLIPRKLFKYNTVTDYFLKGLENHALWFSSPLDFNDPFDCKVNLKYGNIKKDILINFDKLFPPGRAYKDLDREELKEKFLLNPGSFEGMLNTITHYAFGNRLGVCCFSERNDHILMWSHYASNHAGVCLQFNTGRRGLIHDNVLPVQYYSDYPEIRLSEFPGDTLTPFYYHAICAKSDLWDYEFEWRAILANGSKQVHQYALRDLTGIIFGVNTSKENKEKIKDIVINNGFPELQYYQTEMDSKTYRLKIRKI